MFLFSSFLTTLLPIIFGVIIIAALVDLVLRIKKGNDWKLSKERSIFKKVLLALAGACILVLMISVVQVGLPFK